MTPISLPIDQHLPEIIQRINPGSTSTDPFILTSSPGSGKTTRLPVALLKAVQALGSPRKIIVLVPKRIAAVSAAQRICDENGRRLGENVGYEVRFENKTSVATQLIFMTTGHFLKKCFNQNFQDEIGWIIFDEFHERLLENDFLLGYCRERKILRGDLQIIVMSATLSVEELQNYLTTDNWYEIEQYPFKLDLRYSNKTQFLQCNDGFYTHLQQTTREALQLATAHILVFLPGLREIQKAADLMNSEFDHVNVLTFHGQLGLDEQKRIIQLLSESTTARKKYIILATNICETSLTLPNTDCVIDSGLERAAVIDKKFGFSNLFTQRISMFSATQRAGRAARQKDGTCFRLWHKTDERSMRESVTPEVLLRPLPSIFLTYCGLLQSSPLYFEWLTAPPPQEAHDAILALHKRSLITEQFTVTELGKSILSLPLDFDDAFMFYQFCKNDLSEWASEYFARLSDLPRKRTPLSLGEDDLDFIFNLPLNMTQKQKRQQLLELAVQSKSRSLKRGSEKTKTDFKNALVDLHFQFFKHRLFSNAQKHSRSYHGKGAILDSQSAAKTENFYLALQGFESDQMTTQINYAVGLKKTDFLSFSESEIVEKITLEYDDEKKSFFKMGQKVFGAIVIVEEGKKPVALEEIKEHWRQFLESNFDALINQNESYQRLFERYLFVKKLQDSQPNFFDFAPLNDQDLLDLKSLITQILKEFLTDFNDLKTFDIIYAVSYSETENSKLKIALQIMIDLPYSLTLPSGKTCKINYNDEKAPLISAKVQDFYGQKEHFYLFDGRVPLTCELLAPNYRPTQITKDLPGFWAKSYFEVRKELKGRYPKHDWPENPADFKKTLKPK